MAVTGLSAIDTNILVRRITNDSPELSPKAQSILDSAKPDSIVLDRLIIEEVGYVLKAVYHFEKHQIVAVYKALLAEAIFSIPDRELVEASVGYFESEGPLSFEDAWLLAQYKTGRVTNVLTFDKAIQNRIKKIV